MINFLIYTIIACTPISNRRISLCTREYNPVCAEGVTFPNICQAQRAGYYGECASKVSLGACVETPTSTRNADCAPTETFSEKGRCVTKPWPDFSSCLEEKKQGACPGGSDPNSWVSEHCARTCGVFVRTSRLSDDGIL